MFKIALCLRDQHVFMWQSVQVLSVFNTFTLKNIFWWTKSFLKKLEHSFFVESVKTEISSFSYKTAISEANVRTNRMVSTKWTYRKKRSVASNLFFGKLRFSLRASYKELICCTSYPNVNIRTFCKCWSFLWRCLFPVGILESFAYKIVHWTKHFISTISVEDMCNIK